MKRKSIEIPNYCTMNIDFQCVYYEIIFTFHNKDKKKMIKFINDYYLNTNKDFIKNIEPIIEE